MTSIEIIAIAFALAIDAFAVSVGAGMTLGDVSGRQTFRLAWHFGLFQALMPILGWSVGISLQELIAAVDHWIAFGLLALIGGRMVVAFFSNDQNRLINVEPTKGLSLVILSIATSIDALAVGLSLAILGISVWFPAIIIGLVALVFTALGIQLGSYLGRKLSVARYAKLLGGIVLLCIGGQILYDHGVF